MDPLAEFRALNDVIRSCASSSDQRRRWHELKAELFDAQRPPRPVSRPRPPEVSEKA